MGRSPSHTYTPDAELHQLRNALMVAGGYAELLVRHNDLPPQLQHLAAGALGGIRRATQITEEFELSNRW